MFESTKHCTNAITAATVNTALIFFLCVILSALCLFVPILMWLRDRARSEMIFFHMLFFSNAQTQLFPVYASCVDNTGLKYSSCFRPNPLKVGFPPFVFSLDLLGEGNNDTFSVENVKD